MTRLNGGVGLRQRGTAVPRVVTVVGRGHSADIDYAPGEVWATNHAWIYGHTLTKLFLMDGLWEMYKTCEDEGISLQQFLDYLEAHPELELLSAGEEPVHKDGRLVQQVRRFPIEATSALMPGQYFNSSVAHILAYAAAQTLLGLPKIDIIHMIGFELWGAKIGVESYDQEACVNYWIAYLNGQGTKVFLPSTSLFASTSRCNMYGYIR